LWLLGYPDAAFRDADQALRDAREIGHAATLMFALALAPQAHFLSANYATTTAATDELAALADEKGALFWKASGIMRRGWLFAVTGKGTDAVQMNTARITARQSTGSTVYLPFSMTHLAMAHMELCQFDERGVSSAKP
jgi:hypothetical protein